VLLNATEFYEVGQTNSRFSSPVCLSVIRLARCERLMKWSPHLSVCSLSRVRSRKLGTICAEFHYLYKKSGSESKNMTSDFAQEVSKYPQNSPNSLDNQARLVYTQKKCASLLSRCVKRCSLFGFCIFSSTPSSRPGLAMSVAPSVCPCTKFFFRFV